MMKNKLKSALLSLLIAFGLWLYVITEVSPGSRNTIYDIPVVREGETLLNERGLMITAWSATNVDLTLYGNRSDLNEVNAGNITLKADLSRIYDPGVHEIEYTTSYPGNVADNAFVVENKYPDTITITVEKKNSKDVEVTPVYQGTIPTGYVARKGDITLDYEKIKVTGPASVVERIDKAIITIDLNDQKESVSRNYRYTLCDKEGNPVDSELITVNVEEVHVDLTIHRIKQVKLEVTVNDGGGATSDNTIITIDPPIIQVSGSDAALEQVGDTINLGTINLADYETAQQVVFQIPTYDGVTNESAKTEATVDLRFEGLSTKEITIEEFKVTNVPEGYEAEVITEKLIVKVRGPSEVVGKLTAAGLVATVDFSGEDVGTATIRVSIAFDEEFSGLGVLGKPSVTASLQKIEEEEQP